MSEPARPPDRASDDEGGGWQAIAAGARIAARAVGRGAVAVARSVGGSIAAAYHAVDPDARRHLAELPLLGLTLLASRRPEVAALPDDGFPPVVFIHGLGGGTGNFLPMRAWFRLNGRRRLYTVALPDGDSIAELGVRLRGFLDEVAEKNGLGEGARLDLVAHSMGGLVARVALESPETAARVRTLVTLGTPHGGTWAARYAATDRAIELRPGSPLLARLAAQLPWAGPPKLPRLIAFWSDADLLLLPTATALVDGAENVELRGATHTGYLLHPSAWRAVLRAIE